MPEQLFDENHYVLLMPDCPEEFLSSAEITQFLAKLLQAYPAAIDADLAQYSNPEDQAKRLLETTCELEIGPGESVQWYAVRLNKR